MVKFCRRSASFLDVLASTNDRVSNFYASSWQSGDSAIPMLVVRIVLAVIALSILTWSLIEGANPYWLIYLTSWGVALVAATMVLGVAVSIACLSTKPMETTVLPWYVIWYWVTFNIAVTISLTITALYWTLLYDPETHDEIGVRGFCLEVSTHGVTSCIIVLELLISRTPVRLIHSYQPLCLGLAYTAFTIIYYLADGKDINGFNFIYEVLNWRYPKRSSIVIICSVVALLVLYMMVWSVAFFRDKLSIGFVRTTSRDLPMLSADPKIP